MATPYIVFPAILVPVLIINTKCHTSNNTDVIVKYSGHAEAMESQANSPEPKTTEKIKIFVSESVATTEAEIDTTEDVVFVPNERAVERNDDRADKFRINDILYKRTVGDIISDQNVRIETESPSPDVLFISGKNNENGETGHNKKIDRNRENIDSQHETPKKKVLNCTNLACDNTLRSVCGIKKDNGQLKYRLFLNDCYFRKVNCDFKYEESRYKKIELERCKNIGSHNSEKTFSFKPMPLPPSKPEPELTNNFRRKSSSRRSLSMGVDGSFCSHTCPVSCPDDYDPECAVSGSGQRRVFVNHCKMDFNSCSYNVVWHRRPLAECVGGKKADVRQNRAFINWMQKVGIVDNKGRLVLS